MKLDLLVTYALATYRGTRLVMDDEITRDAREAALSALAAVKRENPELADIVDKVEYLIGCPWCVSVWVAGALLLLRKVAPNAADLVAGVLALSATTGLLKSNEYRLGVE